MRRLLPFRRTAVSNDAVAVKESADRLISAGNQAETEGKLLKACECYRAAVEIAPRYPKAHLNLGIGLEAAGDIEGAIDSYETALTLDPENVYVNYNFGKLLCARGAQDRAERLLRAALKHRPDFPEANVALSDLHDSRGDLAAAAAALEMAIKQRPAYFGALYNYATVLGKLGRWGDAEAALRRAVAADPDNLDALNALGNVLARRGQLEEAGVVYRKVLAINAHLPDTLSDFGNVLSGLGQLREAGECYRKAIALDPNSVQAHSNLGNILREEGRLNDAIDCYRHALKLNPEFVEAQHNLCTVLHEQGQPAAAIDCLRKTLERNPSFATGYLSLGNILGGEQRLDEAADCFQKAVALNPDLVDAHFSLGNLHRDSGRLDEALVCYQRALSLDPENIQVRWSIAMSQLPAVYEIDADPRDSRLAFSRDLAKLDSWIDINRCAKSFKSVGSQTPFYLLYQEENNRELFARHGDLCVRIMSDWFKRQQFTDPGRSRSRGGVVRVGVVSRHFQNHSVWSAIVKGWFQRFDRERFAFHAFYLGADCDQETRLAQSLATSFEQGNRSLYGWVQTIMSRQLDVLIYPEIGMDSMTVKLACLRLAPVQATAWGNPETSGLRTIDYFLSAEGMEPEGAEANYTEQLLKLPHLGCHYPPLRAIATPPDLGGLDVDWTEPILICPGTPFKYMPQYDWVFAEIARRLGRCKFIFFRHHPVELSEKLHIRLRTALARKGIDFEKVAVFAPMQKTTSYYGLMSRAHVLLDTIGFSGFNTAMQAVECGLPIVTREGRFLRGRLAGGILKRMQLQELVATTEEGYVDLAVRLCQSPEYHSYIRTRIETNREVLFEDSEPVRALEQFLESAIVE